MKNQNYAFLTIYNWLSIFALWVLLLLFWKAYENWIWVLTDFTSYRKVGITWIQLSCAWLKSKNLWPKVNQDRFLKLFRVITTIMSKPKFISKLSQTKNIWQLLIDLVSSLPKTLRNYWNFYHFLLFRHVQNGSQQITNFLGFNKNLNFRIWKLLSFSAVCLHVMLLRQAQSNWQWGFPDSTSLTKPVWTHF